MLKRGGGSRLAFRRGERVGGVGFLRGFGEEAGGRKRGAAGKVVRSCSEGSGWGGCAFGGLRRRSRMQYSGGLECRGALRCDGGSVPGDEGARQLRARECRRAARFRRL